jgi:NAD(P)-dependent dehydrogenase (short-subunit alcohol dehydrogenase family)
MGGRWEATLNINVHGITHGVRAFCAEDAGDKGGVLDCQCGLEWRLRVMLMQTAYILTKHTVISFKECLYVGMQLKKASIHVSSVIPGMLKTSIFGAEEGAGEPEGADRQRKAMRDMMQSYGMGLEEGCRRIVKGMVANKFWVDTQPEMIEQSVASRVAYFQERRNPKLAESACHLLG